MLRGHASVKELTVTLKMAGRLHVIVDYCVYVVEGVLLLKIWIG